MRQEASHQDAKPWRLHADLNRSHVVRDSRTILTINAQEKQRN